MRRSDCKGDENLKSRFTAIISGQALRTALNRNTKTLRYQRLLLRLRRALPNVIGQSFDTWERRLVKRSGLFDACWYLQKNPDIKSNLLKHYMRQGWRERRSAGPSFDTAWYLDRYADVAASGQNPLLHYLIFGFEEGREPRAYHKARLLIELSGLFDEVWYLAQKPCVDGLDPIEHYLRFGWWDGLSPGPGFNPGSHPTEYAESRKRGAEPLLHYLTRSAPDLSALLGEMPPNPRFVDIASRLVEEAASLQSLVTRDFGGTRFSNAVWTSSIPRSPAIKAWFAAYASLKHTYDYVVFAPWLARGGAEVVTSNMMRAALEKHGYGRVLLVVTDAADMDARDWLPSDTHIMVLSEFWPDLSPEDRSHIVRTLVLSLKPRSILNVNSRALWDAIQQYGRRLSDNTKLFACLFCHDYDALGNKAGYAASHLPKSLPYLTKVYFDNETFKNEMLRELSLSPSDTAGFSVLRQPAGVLKERPPRPKPSNRLRVLWAGRFSRQKNIDLLIEIMKKCSDMDFSVYGEGVGDLSDKLIKASQALNNVRLHGPYSSIEALPVEAHDAYLFTSLWEGMPTSIIKIGALGIPIVASDVGGIGEIISEDTGWLVPKYQKASAYCRALRQIAMNPNEAHERADRLHHCIRTELSWSSFVAELERTPSFLD